MWDLSSCRYVVPGQSDHWVPSHHITRPDPSVAGYQPGGDTAGGSGCGGICGRLDDLAALTTNTVPMATAAPSPRITSNPIRVASASTHIPLGAKALTYCAELAAEPVGGSAHWDPSHHMTRPVPSVAGYQPGGIAAAVAVAVAEAA